MSLGKTTYIYGIEVNSFKFAYDFPHDRSLCIEEHDKMCPWPEVEGYTMCESCGNWYADNMYDDIIDGTYKFPEPFIVRRYLTETFIVGVLIAKEPDNSSISMLTLNGAIKKFDDNATKINTLINQSNKQPKICCIRDNSALDSKVSEAIEILQKIREACL